MKSIESRIEKLEDAIRQINKEPEPFPTVNPTGLSEDEIFAEAERRHLSAFALIPHGRKGQEPTKSIPSVNGI